MITKQYIEVKKEFINSKLLDCQIKIEYDPIGGWVEVVRQQRGSDGLVFDEVIFSGKRSDVYTFLCGMKATLQSSHLPSIAKFHVGQEVVFNFLSSSEKHTIQKCELRDDGSFHYHVDGKWWAESSLSK